jgi:hypothetical protein
MFEDGYVCPVCGFPAVQDAPAGLTHAGWSDEFCESCGYQFGVDRLAFAAWRATWIAAGMPWEARSVGPPDWWNPREHLARLSDEQLVDPIVFSEAEAASIERHVEGARTIALLSHASDGLRRLELTELTDLVSSLIESTRCRGACVQDIRNLDDALRRLVRTQEVVGRVSS